MKLPVVALAALLVLPFPSGAQAFDAQQAMRLLLEVAQPARARVDAARQGGVRDTYDGRDLWVIDGDTFGIGCDRGGRNCAEKIRLKNVDTPETHDPKCGPEYREGLRAKQRFTQLIRGGTVRIERDGIDPHTRTLARVFVAGGDVGEIMVREGLALPWRPGGRAKAERIAHWCGPGNW